jgi:hypothetical protein
VLEARAAAEQLTRASPQSSGKYGEEESINFLEEEARNAARREWYEAKVMERRAA